MRIVFLIVLLLHAIIHFFGFFKSFGIYDFKELTMHVSKPLGAVWLLAGISFIVVGIMYLLNLNYWMFFAFLTVIISQVLIIIFWKDAKFGTIANVIILAVAIVAFSSWKFESGFRKDVAEGIKRTALIDEKLLTASDIQHLPVPLQNYLKYAGVLNKPKVKNFRVKFEAEMRGRDQDWFPLTAEQYNFYDSYERLFFMKAKVKGLPAQGYHLYKEGMSSMNVKLFSLFPVVKVSGPEMFKAETVTVFNDMCFLAPATLIDPDIKWEEIDDRTVNATFTNKAVSISATLYFNDEGQLVNFVSDDRYDVNEMKQYRFSTPLKEYQEINGYRLASYGEAIWHYPEGEFVYGKFTLKEIEYNILD